MRADQEAVIDLMNENEKLRIELYKAIHTIISFPYAQVCKHWAGAKVVQILDDIGDPRLSNELIRAIVRAEDDISLPLLETIIEDSQKHRGES
jgi:hypothetical protein